MVVHASNPRYGEAEAGRSHISGQPELHSEILFQKMKRITKENLYKRKLCNRELRAEVNSSDQVTEQKKKKRQVLVAHTCSPSYSGNKDQEDCS
jgi:hypothetical protein